MGDPQLTAIQPGCSLVSRTGRKPSPSEPEDLQRMLRGRLQSWWQAELS